MKFGLKVDALDTWEPALVRYRHPGFSKDFDRDFVEAPWVKGMVQKGRSCQFVWGLPMFLTTSEKGSVLAETNTQEESRFSFAQWWGLATAPSRYSTSYSL
jgi:hypothetical protein